MDDVRHPFTASFRTLVEQLPLVVYIDEADADCTNLYTSPQTEKMLGYSPLEWQDGSFLESVLHPDDRERVVREMAVEASENGKVSSEYRIVGPDGRIVWVRDEQLRAVGCDGVQGFLLGRPDPPAAIEQLLALRAHKQPV